MNEIACKHCPLRQLPLFMENTPPDVMGLSLVHTNKTMRRLEQLGLHRIVDGRLHLDNPNALAQLADLYGDGSPPKRPLI